MKANILNLIVSLLVGCATTAALAAPSPASVGKAYAVFMATYNPRTREAHGGVAGTAFFISQNRALTAYHVLQPQSWVAGPGEIRQIWLVHEGEPALELNPGNLRYQATSDLSVIQFDNEIAVSKRYVFTVDAKASVRDNVATEGFEANSIGPALAIDGGRLRITSVSQLKRIRAEGSLLREVRVNLIANDVRLEQTPCLNLSYRPIVGMSGGPVIAVSGKVIGVNSFADPGTRSQTWAVKL